ncbi:MAG: hypothetical protein IKX30_00445 [Victivallales bacterium]|nr:hypothetical protein [Victivallales bacterium]
MKKILGLLLLISLASFADGTQDYSAILENQKKELFYLQVMTLFLACTCGLQTVQLMIHAKNQKSLI